MAKYRVLSTKKLEPSLVEQAKQNGIDIIEQEFISVKLIDTNGKFDEVLSYADPKQKRVDHIALTSATAVKALEQFVFRNDANNECSWEIFCLGGKTRDELSKAFGNSIGKVVDTANDAQSLAGKIIESKVKEIVFFCGNKRRDELPQGLREAGINVHEVVVYETVQTPVTVPGDFDAVLFFSPSAVQSFFSANQLKETTVCFAIGLTTANRIADFTDIKTIASALPNQEMMLASVLSHFGNRG